MTDVGHSAEDLLAKSNDFHFLREFTFSCTKFSPTGETEQELADNVVAIGKTLILIQLKARNPAFAKTPDSERSWFKKKVIRDAVGQLRQTLHNLISEPTIQLENRRGHRRSLAVSSEHVIHKVVVHVPQQLIPRDCFFTKHHDSKSCGFVHLFPAQEYELMLLSLLTPAEVSDYLLFRREIISKWPEQSFRVREGALIGQFMAGDYTAEPDTRYGALPGAVPDDQESWSMSHILAGFGESLIDDGGQQQGYYSVLEQLALLSRSELREFKLRWRQIVEDVKQHKAAQPYRMGSYRTGCAFVFVPVVSSEVPRRTDMLKAYTLANKYELRMPRCLGVSVAKSTNDSFDFQWCMLEEPWEEDPELEAFIASNPLFRRTWSAPLPNYKFGQRVGSQNAPKPPASER